MLYLGHSTKIVSDQIKTNQYTDDGFKIIDSTESNNESSIKTTPLTYTWYTGIVFDVNCFSVLDFL